MNAIYLSDSLYEVICQNAVLRQQTPDHFAQEILITHFSSHHPYIEIVPSRSQQSRAVIKGTRIGVEVIVGYANAGYTAQQIATDILPHLHGTQVEDALSYYEDNRADIDKFMQTNTPEVWQPRGVAPGFNNTPLQG